MALRRGALQPEPGGVRVLRNTGAFVVTESELVLGFGVPLFGGGMKPARGGGGVRGATAPLQITLRHISLRQTMPRGRSYQPKAENLGQRVGGGGPGGLECVRQQYHSAHVVLGRGLAIPRLGRYSIGRLHQSHATAVTHPGLCEGVAGLGGLSKPIAGRRHIRGSGESGVQQPAQCHLGVDVAGAGRQLQLRDGELGVERDRLALQVPIGQHDCGGGAAQFRGSREKFRG